MLSSRTCFHLEVQLGLKDLLLSSFTCYWQVSEDLLQLPIGASSRELPYSMAFRLGHTIQEGSHSVFIPSSQIQYPVIYQCLFVRGGSVNPAHTQGENITQGHEYSQEVGLVEAGCCVSHFSLTTTPCSQQGEIAHKEQEKEL